MASQVYVRRFTVDGLRYVALMKYAWDRRYFSFDGERTWHRKIGDAFACAKAAGRLQRDGEGRLRVVEVAS